MRSRSVRPPQDGQAPSASTGTRAETRRAPFEPEGALWFRRPRARATHALRTRVLQALGPGSCHDVGSTGASRSFHCVYESDGPGSLEQSPPFHAADASVPTSRSPRQHGTTPSVALSGERRIARSRLLRNEPMFDNGETSACEAGTVQKCRCPRCVLLRQASLCHSP